MASPLAVRQSRRLVGVNQAVPGNGMRSPARSMLITANRNCGTPLGSAAEQLGGVYVSLYTGGRGLLDQLVVGNIGMVAALDHDPDRPIYRRPLREPGQAGDPVSAGRRRLGEAQVAGGAPARLAVAVPTCPVSLRMISRDGRGLQDMAEIGGEVDQ